MTVCRWGISGLCLLLGALAWSNDTAVWGVGGVIEPMQSHPSVELRSHRVMVTLTPEYADVECTFVLHNTGKATSVLIGFPESGGGVDVDPTRGFERFRSYVDGKRVKVRVINAEKQRDSYWRWYVKRVSFRAGQTRVVRNTYRMPLGIVSMGERFFEYVLTTGASWKGAIGRSEIVVRLVGLDEAIEWQIRPTGYRRDRDRIVWRLSNYEPKEDLYIRFFASYQVVVNGEHYGIIPNEDVERRAGAMFVDARTLAWMLGAKMAWDNRTKRLTLRRGDQKIVMQVGSRWAVVNGKRVQLPAAPSITRADRQEPKVRAPLRAVVNALQGQVFFERKTLTLYITIPQHADNH
ncbi:MAG: copper amine oxidase N-terminal domain-containing protein [Fimbriimonadales bacterium]|nr:MAG: hypothetical protein KatS3mg018_2378 [Fimbriimonadales bacterium]